MGQTWKVMLLVTCLQVLLVRAARKIPAKVNCPLCDIAYADDGVFSFHKTEEHDLSTVAHLEIPVKTYVFNMTSTKFLEGATDEALWWHTVIINIPSTLQHTDTAFLMATGLNSNQRVDIYDKDLIGTARIAAATNSVTAAVYHIPRDPIEFAQIPGDPLGSDRGLMFSQVLFFKTNNPQVHMLPTMVKVVLKAMDLVQNPGIDGYTASVEKFVIGGESKRGWVTWMLGAIDDRVEAIIPVTSSSFLKVDKNVHHMYKSFGGYAFFHAINLYGGLFDYTDTKESRKAARLFDPFAYRKYLDIPKLVIVAASDDVFLPETTKFWMKGMPEETKLWVLENRGHYLEFYPGYDVFYTGMGVFYESVITGFPRPSISWKTKYVTKREVGKVVMFTDVVPKSVKAFYANSVVADRRDFRSVIWCSTCPKMQLCPVCPELTIKPSGVQWIEDTEGVVMAEDKVDGKFKYYVRYSIPSTGYLGFFMQMVFEGPGGKEMMYTSEVNIIPNTFPSEDCIGSACGNRATPIY